MAQPDRDHRHQHQEASGSSNSCPPPPSFLLLIKNTYLTSFQILLSCHPRIYLTIFTFTTLPLSLLFLSLSLSTRRTLNHFHRLHYLSSVASTDVESLHVLKEARSDAFSLFFLKATYALPSLFFSLISLITTVAATYSAINPQQQQQAPPARLALLARTWKRPFWTSMVAYAITFSSVHITHTLMKPLVRMGTMSTIAAFVVVDLIVEVYLMAVVSVGLVVSVVEEDQSGFEAIRIGWRLMEGTRVFGWFISGGFLFVSGWIGKQLRMMDGGEEEDLMKMNIFSYCYKGGLVISLALVVLWSYIVGTVYYCQCRRRWQDQRMVQGHEEDQEEDDDGDDHACTNLN